MVLLRKGVTLYFPGPYASALLPDVVAATREALLDLGIDFVMREGIVTSGYHAWFAGYEAEFALLKERNESWLRDERVTRIITNDPHEALTFRERYGIPATLVVELFAEHDGRLRPGRGKRVVYHHPCVLNRLGVDEKRVVRLLRRLGMKVEERPTRCCGSVGDDYARNNPGAAGLVAKRRAEELGETLIVTCCPYCNALLARQGRRVVDVAELVVEGA